MRVGGIVSSKRPQEGEDVLAHDDEHVRGGKVLEARPAQVVVCAASGILAFRKDAALDGLLQARGLVLLQRVQVVEAAEKEQIRNLLDDFKGVGDAAGPERVPDAVDLTADIACQHGGIQKLEVRSWKSEVL